MNIPTPLPLEISDPELSQLLIGVLNGKIPAVISNGEVYECISVPGSCVRNLRVISYEIPRNGPCVCGSKKKFKKCCLNKEG